MRHVPSSWRRTIGFAGLCLAGWSIAIGLGMSVLWKYNNQPGQASAAPVQWPLPHTQPLKPNQMTLVMSVHPRCPCTRSSLSELARLMRHAQGKIDCIALFKQPEEMNEQWINTDLRTRAQAIPGVRVVIDHGGKQTQLLGMKTSGAVVMYNPSGLRVFDGGITSSRGHEGDNAGRDAILALLTQPALAIASTPVFGCEINNPCPGGSP